MMHKLLKDEAGFTLIELLIVVVIIGILAAVGVPIYSRYIYTAKASEAPTIMGALIEYMESYGRAHPEIVDGTDYTDWGMLGSPASTLDAVTNDWVDEIVGADNEYFEYYYALNTTGLLGGYSSPGPCLYARGKDIVGGTDLEFQLDDELVYFMDPNASGELDQNWWSGNANLLDIVPD